MRRFKALLFDINGTLTDINTCEDEENAFRTTANFLGYHGVIVRKELLKEEYISLNRKQRSSSPEQFPEFNVTEIFLEMIRRFKSCDIGDEKELALCAAEVFRAASLRRLEPYSNVNEVLTMMKKHYRLGAVSDGQSPWAMPELRMAGLAEFFEIVTVSGDFGFRKPDPRMFTETLKKMDLKNDEVIFIGNDMYRDIYGAGRLGIKSVLFKSNQGEQRYAGAEPDYIVYDFSEIPEAVAFLEQ